MRCRPVAEAQMSELLARGALAGAAARRRWQQNESGSHRKPRDGDALRRALLPQGDGPSTGLGSGWTRCRRVERPWPNESSGVARDPGGGRRACRPVPPRCACVWVGAWLRVAGAAAKDQHRDMYWTRVQTRRCVLKLRCCRNCGPQDLPGALRRGQISWARLEHDNIAASV